MSSTDTSYVVLLSSGETAQLVASTAEVQRVIGKPFPKGVSGNPAGRPAGSRNKITELFMTAMRDDFALYGRAAIAALRERDPAQYLAAVRSIIPNRAIEEHESKPTELDSLSDEEFAAAMDSGMGSKFSQQRRMQAVEMVMRGEAASVCDAMRLLNDAGGEPVSLGT